MSRGLRKGAWTEEEDTLLRNCILRFGEGRWHQVPMRAGLNRCRKSCRLRWLNYLQPNVNRGEFKEDEVDLIVKLHRLLGNRWTLIAGRLPGRTANDIKNYWNTHINKKKQQRLKNNPTFGAKLKDSNDVNIVKTTVFKPHPRTFSKSSPWVWKNSDININDDQDTNKDYHETGMWWERLLLELEDDHGKCVYGNWWETLLFDEEENDVTKIVGPISFQVQQL